MRTYLVASDRVQSTKHCRGYHQKRRYAIIVHSSAAILGPFISRANNGTTTTRVSMTPSAMIQRIATRVRSHNERVHCDTRCRFLFSEFLESVTVWIFRAWERSYNIVDGWLRDDDASCTMAIGHSKHQYNWRPKATLTRRISVSPLFCGSQTHLPIAGPFFQLD